MMRRLRRQAMKYRMYRVWTRTATEIRTLLAAKMICEFSVQQPIVYCNIWVRLLVLMILQELQAGHCSSHLN